MCTCTWGILKIKEKIKRVNRIKKKGKGEKGRREGERLKIQLRPLT